MLFKRVKNFSVVQENWKGSMRW